MKKLIIIFICLVVFLFGSVIYIVNRNNNYLNNILEDIKNNSEIKEDIIYYNKYSNVINKIDYLLTNKIVSNDIEAVEKYRFDKNIEVNDIEIFIENKIKIVLNGNNICIYDKDISDSGNYSLCDYIYILNNEEEVYIDLNDNMKVLFYNAYSNFSNKFLEHLYTTWIDTYIINKDNLTILELKDNDYIIKEISG